MIMLYATITLQEPSDWERPAEAIRRQIRALSPSPGAGARLGGKEIKILDAREATDDVGGDTEAWRPAKPGTIPGTILGAVRRQGPVVATGKGRLVLTALQPQGKKAMDGWSWLNGSRLQPGSAFEKE